jgi:hypothetical protein
LPQRLLQILPALRVNHVGLGQPALAGDTGSETQEVEVVQPMGVAVDHAFHAEFLGLPPQTPIEIESIRARIEFNPSARRRARLQHRRDIQLVGVPLQ